MDQNQMELFKTVCFVALMQHGQRLTSKAPEYILKKMKTSKDPLAAWQMLDSDGQVEVWKWALLWDFPIKAIIQEIQKNPVVL